MAQMTNKQEAFARHLFAGMMQTDAYREAYNTVGMQSNTVWSEASKLMRPPQVSTRIEMLKAEAAAARRVLLLDREEVILAQLECEALTAKTDAARIRALELLGRHAGMFAERVEVERVERTAAQIETEVKARLMRLGLVGDSVDA